MKKKLERRIVSFMMAVILVIGTLKVPGLTLEVHAAPGSGTVGSLTWVLDANGQLTIGGTGAFPDVAVPWDADEVKHIIIGSGVTDVTEADLMNCSNLEDISVEGGNTAYSSEDGILFNKDKTKIVKYPSKKAGVSYNVPDSVTVIGTYAFNLCSNLTSISLPAGVTAIDAAAFSRCSGLKDIYIPDSVTVIGKYAFDRCIGLEQMILPAGVTSIGEGAFRDCVSMNYITFPANTITVGKDAFKNCDKLEDVYLAGQWSRITVDYTGGGNDSLSHVFFSYEVPVLDFILKTATLEINDGESADLEMVMLPSYATEKNVTWESSDTSVATVADGTVTGEGPGTATVTVKTADGEKTASCTVNVGIGGTFGDGWSYELDQNGKLTISGTGAMPDFHEGGGPWNKYSYKVKQLEITNGVTSIGNFAFNDCSKLTGITLPAGVTSIGAHAFSSCTNLTNVTLPAGVTNIGDYAFASCDGLTSITIPSGVISIGEKAFENCSGLANIIIPDSVTSIGEKAFSNCDGLTGITIPAGVTAIGSGAFGGADKLQEINVSAGNLNYRSDGGVLFSKDNVLIAYPCGKAGAYSIPSGVTAIGDKAFSQCTGLTAITIPSGVTNIGDYAFYDCMGLTGITLPDGVTVIGDSAFCGCSGLTGITIPSGVTSIGNGAFANCDSLTSITIPDSVTSIGDHAFANCSGLTGITIPAGVTAIGSGAFGGADKLQEINVSAGNLNYRSDGGVLFSKDNVLIAYPCGKAGAYSIPSGVTGIGDRAFSGCSGLTGITLPAGVASIGRYAFENCVKLTGITLPDSVTVIGNDAFCFCSGLTSIAIPAGVTVIDDGTFAYCGGLTSITLPDSITDIGGSAFYACGSLTDVYYEGTEASWNSISIIDFLNEPILNAQIHYNTVPVQSIIFKLSVLKLKVGESAKPETELTPSYATENLIWESSNTSVATVADGTVTAVAEGEAVITVTTEDSGKSAICKVTVVKTTGPVKPAEPEKPAEPDKPAEPEIVEGPLGPEKPDLSRYTASGNEIAVKSVNLKKTVFKDVKGIKKFNVTAKDASAVKIKGSTLTVLKDATVTIEAVNKKKEKIAEKTITVIAPQIDTKPATEINRRGTLDLNKYILSTVQPSGWKSSNKKVATVSENGLLLMKKSGTVKITVTFPAEKGMTAKKLTIKLKIKMPQFKKTSYTVKTGKTVKTAVKNAEASEITYRIEDPSVATVDATGKVTGVSKGTTKLIMRVRDIDYETTIKVK